MPDFKTSALFTGSTGEEAEAFIYRELQRAGYRILEQNLRSPFGEIDLIARKKNSIAFIEVKYRHDAEHGDPAEFVTPAKQRRIAKTAQWWLMHNPAISAKKPTLSFDVAAISGAECRYLHNAYETPCEF